MWPQPKTHRHQLSFLRAIIDLKKGTLKIQIISIQQRMKNRDLIYMIIANTIMDPFQTLQKMTQKCDSLKSELLEQTKQARSFPVLPTVA